MTTKVQIHRHNSINTKHTRAPKHTHLMHHASKHVQCTTQFHTHTHKHTPSRVDGWGTRAQFGPDILGQYNTQLLSLITLAGTIKPRSAIAHASQGENLFSLLHRHHSPSRGHESSLDPLGPKQSGPPRCVLFTLYEIHKHQPGVNNGGSPRS